MELWISLGRLYIYGLSENGLSLQLQLSLLGGAKLSYGLK